MIITLFTRLKQAFTETQFNMTKALLLIWAISIVHPARAETVPSVDQFVEIALGQEYAAERTHLRRWLLPIRIEIHQETLLPGPVIKLIDELLALLTSATGHAIDRVSTDGNVQLYFVTSRDAQRRWREVAVGEFPADALCAAQIRTSRTGEITNAVVLIPSDRASQQGRLLSCIVEELTQITGLANDSDLVFPSIFNDRSTNQMVTPMDWLMLRALYDQSLQPGMVEADVRPVVQQILSQLVTMGELERAKSRIKKSELFELLNVN